MTEPQPLLGSAGDIDDDVDSLLLYAECRHFGEAEGFNAAHLAFQRCGPTPEVDDGALAGGHAHRLGRKQIYDDLQRTKDGAAVRRIGVERARRHLVLDPDDARALYMAANGMAALGEGDGAREWAQRARALRPDDGMVLYNVACVFALLGLPDAALDGLERAVRGGLKQRGWYEHDSNLDPLRSHQRFQDLLQGL